MYQNLGVKERYSNRPEYASDFPANIMPGHPDEVTSRLRWIQEPFTAEALKQKLGDNGERIFIEMIRVQEQESELQAKSQSYKQRVRVTAGQNPEFEPNRPEKVPE